MNYRYKTKVLIFMLGLLIVACSPRATPPNELITTLDTAETPSLPPPTNTIITSDPTGTSTPTFTPTPIAHLIDSMDRLNWKLGFCDEHCGGSNGSSSITNLILVSDRTDNPNSALEISYDIKTEGWVSIAKKIDPEILLETIGLSFFYKGTDASNTIELKLVLKYPGDKGETTFGAFWNRATDTGDQWTQIEALYDVEFECWWPEELCQVHEDNLDLTAVESIDLAISNRSGSGDIAGSGKVAFDDLAGISRP